MQGWVMVSLQPEQEWCFKDHISNDRGAYEAFFKHTKVSCNSHATTSSTTQRSTNILLRFHKAQTRRWQFSITASAVSFPV